jgi:predicted metalloprotease with PDZ domain
LWFCEGVTNTFAQLALLRADMIDRKTFYDRVAGAIQVLQSRNSRRFQSAETAGREAWLEKYSEYNRMDRSVSYYNKGELLGYLLDLGIRHASQNQAGLDDVMRRLNQDFARRGRFYSSADLSAVVAQLAPTFDMNRFLADDVRGTQELDYSTYLGYAGLSLTWLKSQLPVPGFSASRNAGGLLEVDSVDEGSDAERAGLQMGDVLTMTDGNPMPTGANATLPNWRPGQNVEMQVVRGGKAREIKFRVGATEEISVRIGEDPNASRDQLQVRKGWLKGVTNPTSGKQ